MDARPIAFLDSGVGGLPYLEWTRKRLPAETFVYLADRANFPYGTKSPETILEAVFSAVARLIRIIDPKMIVIACNTATVVSIAELRKAYPGIPFVGVVPAVKPASAQSVHRRIGVLATKRTVEDAYLKNLISEYASDCLVVKVAGGNIVDFVEYDLLTAPVAARYEIFETALQEFMAAEVDSIVLGCTHFLFLLDEIRKSLASDIAVIDSREGVGKQIVRMLAGKDLEAGVKGEDVLYLTGSGPAEERYHKFADRFGLRCMGSIDACTVRS